MISAAEKKALDRKLNSLVVKKEKLSTAKKTADFSLKEVNKKMRRFEADARLLEKKFRRAKAEISDRKGEETRLIVTNKTLRKAVEKHKKEARRLFFSLRKKRQCLAH